MPSALHGASDGSSGGLPAASRKGIGRVRPALSGITAIIYPKATERADGGPSVRQVTQSFRALSAAAAICLGLAVLAAASAAAGGGAAGAALDSQAGATATIYLARHGETEGEGPGRWLSAAGRSRAEALAERLADAGIERIYTTDLPRTRETAAPIAARLGLEPELYDPDDLAGFAAELRRAHGVLLVVGHSNTNPELVGLLGGEPGEPIAEDEHDRLYRLELPGGATELSRFGPG